MALARNLAWCILHHARFMAQAIYYVKLCLLDTFLSPAERVEVERMAEFVGAFYIRWWLQCTISTSSSINDLHAVWEMRQYHKIRTEVGDACLKSISRHFWYVTENLVMFSHADENLPHMPLP